MADVEWTQKGRRKVDITPIFNGGISSLTGFGLYQNWPQPGVKIGQHWELVSTYHGANRVNREYEKVKTAAGEEITLKSTHSSWYTPIAQYLSTGSLILMDEWKFAPTMVV